MGKTTIDYFSTDHLKSKLRTRALKGASITIIAQFLNFGISTIGTIILARLLTPDDFGLVAMALTFSLLLQNFGFNGFTEAIIQRPEINHKQISTLFWINLSISLGLTILFATSSPLISWFYKDPRLNQVIIVISTSILFVGLSTEHQALLNRKLQFHKTAINTVGATLLSVTTAILLATFGWGYWALVSRWVLLPFFTTVGAWILCRWRPGLPRRGTEIKPMLNFAVNTYGNFIVSYLRRNIDKILLGRFYGPQSLGYYDRAYQTSNMLPNLLVQPMATVAVATMSRLSTEPDKYRHSYLEVISIIAFIGMLASAIITITGTDLVLLLLGPQWRAAGKLLSVFGISIGITLIYSTHGWVHLSLGTPDRWFRWGTIALFVTAFCLIIGVYFGTLGLAISYSASFYILIGPGLWYAGKKIHLKISSVIAVAWKYFISGLCAGIVSWLLLHSSSLTSFYFENLNIFIRIIVASILCTFLYLLFIIVLNRGIKPISNFILVLREMIPNDFFVR